MQYPGAVGSHGSFRWAALRVGLCHVAFGMKGADVQRPGAVGSHGGFRWAA